MPRTTYQSWLRERLVDPSAGDSYRLEDIIEAILVAALREQFTLSDARSIWRAMRRDGSRQVLISQACELKQADRFDLVIEPKFGRVTLARTDKQLLAAVRPNSGTRSVAIFELAGPIRDAVDAFAMLGDADQAPAPSLQTRRSRATVASIAEAR